MSDKPVAERLQVKGERRLAVVGASAAVDNKIGVKKQRCDMSEADVILLFAADCGQLDSTLSSMLKNAPKDAIIGSPIQSSLRSLQATLVVILSMHSLPNPD